MKYREPEMNLSVFDTENVITASADDIKSEALTKAYNAAQDKAGTEGIALQLLF